MKFDTVIFDLDGTLLDSLEDLADSVNDALQECGYPLRTLGEIRGFIGSGIRMLIQRSLPPGVREEEIDCCVRIFHKYYKLNMDRKTRPYKGIIPLLQKLKRENIKLAIVSNKYDVAVQQLNKKFFAAYMDTAIGEKEGIRRKPAADGIQAAMQRLGALPQNTLYVGDSDIDIQTARNAGVCSVGVTWGYRTEEELLRENPFKIINTPSELFYLMDV